MTGHPGYPWPTPPPNPQPAQTPRNHWGASIVAALTVIGGIATIVGLVGTYVAWTDRYRPVTLADWSREAMAVCERRSHEVRVPVRGSLDEFTELLDQIQTATATGNAPDLTRLRDSAARLEDYADAIREMTGDFRAIARPPASNAAIENLLAQSGQVSASFTELAAGIRELDGKVKRIDWRAPETSTGAVAEAAATVQGLLPAVQKMDDTVLPAWNQSLHDLHIDACMPAIGGYSRSSDMNAAAPAPAPAPAPTASPPATTSVQPPVIDPDEPVGETSSAEAQEPPISTTVKVTVKVSEEGREFTGAEAELLGAINGREYRICSPNSEGEDAATVAALNCVAVRPGPQRKPFIARATSSTALASLAANEGASVQSSSECSRGEDFKGTWHNASQTAGGTMICRTKGKYFRIWWADSRTNIYMAAEGEDSAALYQWWKEGVFLSSDPPMNERPHSGYEGADAL